MVSKILEYHDNIRMDVVSLLPGQAGRVLDFGGGIGATSGWLKRTGRASDVTVADQVAESVPEVDRKIVGDLDDPEAVRRALSSCLAFDTILCLDILEHLRDPWVTLDVLVDTLVPGGTAVISVPNVNFRGIVLPLVLRGRWELTDNGPLDRTHLRWFTRDSLIDMARGADLQVDRVFGTVSGFSRTADRLTFGALNRFLAVQYVLVARKPGPMQS